MRLLISCLWLSLLALQTHADEFPSESRVSITGQPEMEQINDVDEIITNKQLRASTGSKSRLSLALGLNYSGGSLNAPLSEDRPNISGGTGATDFASAGGSVSVKYNLTARQALLGGIGVRLISPLQGTSTPQGYNGDKMDASNPYLNYQYIYKVAGIQSVVQASATFFTQSDLVREGFVMSLGLSQNNIYEFGHSGFSVGSSYYVGTGFYNQNDPVSLSEQSDYSFGISPYVEYQITEMVNFHTGWSWTFEHIRNQPSGNTYRQDLVTQNLGFGFSITRDIFLYPNIAFMPNNIRADSTLVALGANINIF